MAAQGYIGRAPGESSVVVARQTFTPTGITTNFTFASGYTVGYVDAYLNGARLIEGSDYTATDGSVVGLSTNAINGDVLELVAYKAFNVSNVTGALSDFSVGGDLSVTGNASVTGTTTLSGNTTVGTGITLDTNGNVNVSGVLTANSFVGDGTQLTGVGGGSVISGITIREEGSVVGTSGTVVNLNFVGADVTATAQAGFSTITIAGGGKFINFTDGGSTGITTTAKTKIQNNLEVTGVGTVTGDLTVGGVLTYADVTNVDSIGIITARSHVSIADSILHTGDTDTSIRFPAAGTFTVETNGSERLRIDSSGFITQKFTSNNSTTAEGLFINNLNNGTGNNASLIFSNDSGERKKAAIALIDTGNYGAGDLVFALDSADSGELHLTNDEKVRITSAGRIGVGTVGPTHSLHVYDTTDNSAQRNDVQAYTGGITIQNQAEVFDAFAALRFNFHGDDSFYLKTRRIGNNNGEFEIGQNYSSTSTDNIAIKIDNSLNVGIGSTIPARKLDVNGPVRVNQTIEAYNTSGGSQDWFVSSDSFGFHNGTGVAFNAGGGLFRLGISGSEKVRVDVGGNVNITGIATATQFDATSDVTLKENIEVIDEPIVKLSELKGVTFDWKVGGHSVGVIAQDVEKVLPTAVGGSEDRKTVNYNAIIGLLVESVKDQQKQIEELKSLLDK